ncbi:hypothetical protein RB653_005810 [Dictyostelium firmibasis]|uniref:Uncharacterized protein n=1 Tax=Dictyostelium firmibasis TaxID=79012 RepID=A0AAN7U8A1_9MYCE
MIEKNETIKNIDSIVRLIINQIIKKISTQDFEECFRVIIDRKNEIEFNEYSGLYLWVSLREESIKNNLDYYFIIEKFKTFLNNNKSDDNKNIKTLQSLYDSSIVSNTFLQKDIRPIQKYYLSNYQITPKDCSTVSTTTTTTTITPPTQLIKVYSDYKKESMVLRDTFADKSIFKREEITKEEKDHPFIDFSDYILDEQNEINQKAIKELGINPVGDWSINNSFELFKDCFNIFTKGVLNGIEWSSSSSENNSSKVIASGGSISSCLSTLPKRLLKLYYEMKMVARLLNHLDLPFNVVTLIYEYAKPYNEFFVELENHYHSMKSPFLNSDLDLFFITPSIHEGKKKLEEVALKIQSNINSKSDHMDLRFVRTQNSITIVSSYPYRPIQLMIFFIRSIEDLISFYDLDCVATAYNGENVFLLPRTINSFNKRLNMVPPALFNPDNDRLYKYIYRGFNAMCFENCIHETRCDKNPNLKQLILQPNSIKKNAHGRPEFIVSSYNEDSASSFNFPYGPDKSFEDVLEELQTNNYTNFDSFKQELFDDRTTAIKTHPCDWRFKFIKIKNLASNVSFKCYMCKKNLEDTTSRLCSYCTFLNESLLDDLSYEVGRARLIMNEKYAIVTGGRIKIGFKIAMILLKLEFNVIITTRFPQSAMEKFKELAPPDRLKRLRIYGVDFRNVQAVQLFIDTIKLTIPRIDILINNAAQTIRRPRAYYYDLIQKEKQLSLNNSNSNETISSNGPQQQHGVLTLTCKKNEELLTISSTEIVEKVLIDCDKDESNFELFPPGQVDEHGEQLDLRKKTSWIQSVEEISVVEVAEVSLVNSTIPFMLVSQLSSMMGLNCLPDKDAYKERLGEKERIQYEKSLKLIKRNDWSYIVNVTSPEGEFKNEINSLTGLHVHTNMAKSSLNMMTKTVAYTHDLKNIYVCGADTGWISDMQPKRNDLGLPSRDPPLTDEDGANRVLYPILHHMVEENRYPSGVNFVNFKPVEWQ